MTPEPGSGGSPLWIGVALVFVGMVTKDLFTSTEAQGKYENICHLNPIFDSL